MNYKNSIKERPIIEEVKGHCKVNVLIETPADCQRCFQLWPVEHNYSRVMCKRRNWTGRVDFLTYNN